MRKSNNSCKRRSKGLWAVLASAGRAGLWALLVGMLLSGSLQAQQSVTRCQDFDLIMQRIKTSFGEEDYAKVLVQLQAARACDPSWDGLNNWYQRVFNAINRQKDTAEREKANAVRARERADNALERAEQAALAERKAAEEAEAQRLLAVTLQQLAETRSRTALANELAFNARILFKEGQRDKALGLVDFAYYYVDSLNPLVQSVLFDIFYANIKLEAASEEAEAAPPQQIAIAWSPDGQYQAAAYDNGQLKILNSESTAYVAELEIAVSTAPSITWSPDGAYLVVAVDFGELKIWETATWQELPGFSVNTEIICLDWQPGGNTIAIGARDGYIYLRNPFNGESPHLPLQVHTDWIRSVAWSPDGSLLASCSDDRTVVVFKADDFSQLANYQAHTDWVRDIAWSPSGGTLVSVGDDGRVVLWKPLEDGTTGVELMTQTDWIMQVGWSTNGQQLVTSNNAGVLNLIALRDGQLLSELKLDDRMVNSLDWQPAGSRIALAATSPQEMSIWADWDGTNLVLGTSEMPDDRILTQSRGQGSQLDKNIQILSVDWSANSRHLAAGANDGTIRIFHTNQPTEPSVWNSGQEQVLDVGWSKNDRYLASIGADNTIKIWEAASGEIKAVFRLERNIRSLDWSPVDFRLAVSCDDQFVYLYDIERQRQVLKLSGHTDWVRGVSWSPDGKRLATCSDDLTVKIWNGENGSLISQATEHQNYVLSIAWAPKGNRLASCDNLGEVIVWQTEELKPVYNHSLGESVASLSWSADGRFLAAGTREGTIIQFEDSLKTEVNWAKTPLSDLAYSSDGRLLGIAVNGGGPAVLEVAKEAMFFPQWRNYSPPKASLVYRLDSILNLQLGGFQNSENGLFYAPNGSLLAYVNELSQPFIWDVRRDKLLPLEGHADWVRDFAWSPDSKRIATASDDGTIKVWNPVEGNCVWTSAAVNRFVYKVSWSPDGRMLAAADIQGNTRLYAKDRTGMGFRLVDSLRINGEPGLLRFTANSLRLLLGTSDSLLCWQVSEKRAAYRRALPASLTACHISYDGSLLISLESGDYPTCWNLDNGKEIYTPVSKRWPCTQIAWSSNSLGLALVSTSKQVHLWDASRWQPITILDKFDQDIKALAWSPRGDQLATATQSGVTQLWDIESGQEVLRTPPSSDVTGLRWSPDRSNLLAIVGGFAKFWRMDFGLLLNLVRSEQETKPLGESDLASYGLERALQLNPDAIYKITSREKEGQLVSWGRYFMTKARNSLDWPSAQRYLDYALSLFERADSLSSVNWYYEERAAGHTYYAYEKLKQGDAEEAEAQLRRAFALSPDYPDALLLQGFSNWIAGRKKQGVQQIMDARMGNTSYDLINVLLVANAAGLKVPDMAELYRFVTYDTPAENILDQLNLPNTALPAGRIAELTAMLSPEAQSRYKVAYILQRAAAATQTDNACDLLLQALQTIEKQTSILPETWQSFNSILLEKITAVEQGNMSQYRPFFPLLEVLTQQASGNVNWLELARVVFRWKRAEESATNFANAAVLSNMLNQLIEELTSQNSDYEAERLNNLVDKAWYHILLNETTAATQLLEPLLSQPLVESRAKLKQAHLMLVQSRQEEALEGYREVIRKSDSSLRDMMLADLALLGTRASLVEAQVQGWSTAVAKIETDYSNALASRQSYYERANQEEYTQAIDQSGLTLATWQQLQSDCANLAQQGLSTVFCDSLLQEMGTEYGNQSFYMLFTQRYEEAVASAQAGFRLARKNWIRTNEGHGYLYDGNWAQARQVYLAIKDLPDETGQFSSLTETLLADFQSLRNAGVWHKDVLKAAALLLGHKLTAEERQTYGREPIPE